MMWHDSAASAASDRDRILPVYEGEEIPMTMQVGMVGSDGVLIASDTLWQNTELTQRFGNVRHRNQPQKFKLTIKNKWR
jgi:hypothetical protein